jgi:hypothetical protein
MPEIINAVVKKLKDTGGYLFEFAIVNKALKEVRSNSALNSAFSDALKSLHELSLAAGKSKVKYLHIDGVRGLAVNELLCPVTHKRLDRGYQEIEIYGLSYNGASGAEELIKRLDGVCSFKNDSLGSMYLKKAQELRKAKIDAEKKIMKSTKDDEIKEIEDGKKTIKELKDFLSENPELKKKNYQSSWYGWAAGTFGGGAAGGATGAVVLYSGTALATSASALVPSTVVTTLGYVGTAAAGTLATATAPAWLLPAAVVTIGAVVGSKLGRGRYYESSYKKTEDYFIEHGRSEREDYVKAIPIDKDTDEANQLTIKRLVLRGGAASTAILERMIGYMEKGRLNIFDLDIQFNELQADDSAKLFTFDAYERDLLGDKFEGVLKKKLKIASEGNVLQRLICALTLVSLRTRVHCTLNISNNSVAPVLLLKSFENVKGFKGNFPSLMLAKTGLELEGFLTILKLAKDYEVKHLDVSGQILWNNLNATISETILADLEGCKIESLNLADTGFSAGESNKEFFQGLIIKFKTMHSLRNVKFSPEKGSPEEGIIEQYLKDSKLINMVKDLVENSKSLTGLKLPAYIECVHKTLLFTRTALSKTDSVDKMKMFEKKEEWIKGPSEPGIRMLHTRPWS